MDCVIFAFIHMALVPLMAALPGSLGIILLYGTLWFFNLESWATSMKQEQKLRRQSTELIAVNELSRRQTSELIAVNKKLTMEKKMMLAGGGIFVGSFAAVVVVSRVSHRMRPCLHDHVRKEVTPHSVRRVVEIECPGVVRSGIIVRVPPQMNGAVVEISRSAALGRRATMSRKQFIFPWHEGSFECREDEMQLEHGVLRLTFEAELKRERLLHLPPPWTPQVFDFAEGDVPTPPSLPSSDGRTLKDEESSVVSHLQVHHCQDAAEKEGQEEMEEQGKE